ncbi:uncharacterized protein LOC128388877 [Panonychus citri]|nr:uncharacterized protein LOC128388877 [Panonychus citri]
MVSMNYLLDFEKLFRPGQLKQIYCMLDFHMNNLSRLVKYFPNLKRLNLSFQGRKVRYNGPNLSNLKIFEASVWDDTMYETSGYLGICNTIHVMDFCPSLESAHIHGQLDDEFTNMALKNYNLRDLVFSTMFSLFDEYLTWPFLRTLLSKYPNLQHLAVRGGDTIEDSHVEELLELLPRIKLLDFRKSNGVTVKSADFLSKFCLKSNRSIKIYYDCEKEPDDWPKLDTPRESIVCGFDFMKHCFYKTFYNLPELIDE